jgi:hypothetical protein
VPNSAGQKPEKEKEWFIGKMIEAQDTFGKWFLSEVVDVCAFRSLSVV